MSPGLLSAADLHFGYAAGLPVLNGVSLRVGSGEVVALLGANGGGKSTLLKLLLGFLRPSRGEVCLDGRSLHGRPLREIARRVAYVPQSQGMPFPYRVYDLVALARIPFGGLFKRLRPRDREAVAAALDRLDIAPLANRIYTELSGGQRQLCRIACALAQEARTIVMDEPVSGLDYGNQWRLLALIRELAAEGRGIILSSHHPDHVLNAASRALLLHQGRIIADGAPESVVTPAHIRRLYDLEVDRHPLPDGLLTLVPRIAETELRHA